MGRWEGIDIKKKIMICLCAGVMALALAGCKDKNDNKNTTSESQIDDLSENENPDDTGADWILGGCDRTGYIEIRADWMKYESTANGNDVYSLQYYSTDENQAFRITLVDNDYGYDPEDPREIDNPAAVVISRYIEEYEKEGGYNVGADEVIMGGVLFYRTIDCVPAGGYADFDYYFYTYVTYVNERFYTVIIEGMEDAVKEPIERIEDTFSLDGSGSSSASDAEEL